MGDIGKTSAWKYGFRETCCTEEEAENERISPAAALLCEERENSTAREKDRKHHDDACVLDKGVNRGSQGIHFLTPAR